MNSLTKLYCDCINESLAISGTFKMCFSLLDDFSIAVIKASYNYQPLENDWIIITSKKIIESKD
jgi:hypothetical protein